MRQRDLHMTRHGGCQESAAHTTSRACACVLSALCCGWPREHVRTSHALRTWRGTVAQSLLYYAITPRARARPTATTPTECAGLEVRGVAVETQSAVVHFGVYVTLAHGAAMWRGLAPVG